MTADRPEGAVDTEVPPMEVFAADVEVSLEVDMTSIRFSLSKESMSYITCVTDDCIVEY